MEYYIKKKTILSYENAIEKTKEELKKEGFGILSEIDVKKTIKKKIDKDFNKYIILGACNPNLAYDALNNEIEIGLLLPCNVIVYEKNKEIFVAAIDPVSSMSIIENENINSIAQKVKNKLDKVIKSI